jgi:lipopolysaccharide/colanic/teichoic acid biosynthesis glycosyltransferase
MRSFCSKSALHVADELPRGASMLGLDARALSPSSQARLFSRLSICDVAWAAASPALSYIIRDGGIDRPEAVVMYCVVAFIAALLTFQLFRISQPMSRFFSVRDAVEVAKSCLVSVAIAGAFLFTFTRMDETPRSVPLIHFLVLASGLIAGRGISRSRHRWREASKPESMAESVENIVVVGMSRLASFYSKLVEEFADGESRIVALLDERPQFQQRSLNGYLVAGSPLHASKIFDEYATHGVEIHKIAIAVPRESLSGAAWNEINRIAKTRRMALEILPERLLPARATKTLVRIHSGDARRHISSTSARWVWKLKRVVDICFAAVTLLAISPLAIVVMLLVLVDVGYPIVFWQQRVGRLGKPLHIYKFRTMQTPFDRTGHPVPESERLSSVGRLLRATRLDEIPQLWNIFIGEMSVIGPRPLLPIDQPKTFSTRLYVRPGLTGLAQISGGKLLSIEEKDALDEHYVRHGSIFLDLSILTRTLWVMIRDDRRNEVVIAAALAEKQEHVKAKIGILPTLEISREPHPVTELGSRVANASSCFSDRPASTRGSRHSP